MTTSVQRGSPLRSASVQRQGRAAAVQRYQTPPRGGFRDVSSHDALLGRTGYSPPGPAPCWASTPPAPAPSMWSSSQVAAPTLAPSPFVFSPTSRPRENYQGSHASSLSAPSAAPPASLTTPRRPPRPGGDNKASPPHQPLAASPSAASALWPPPQLYQQPSSHLSSVSHGESFASAALSSMPSPPPHHRPLSSQMSSMSHASSWSPPAQPGRSLSPPSLPPPPPRSPSVCSDGGARNRSAPPPPPPPMPMPPEDTPSLAATASSAVRRRLADAATIGDAGQLRATLADAQRSGVQGREVTHARDALLAIEAQEHHQRADTVVEEAVRSDDWWKLQAAMQMVTGLGMCEDHVERLKEAMRMHKRRQNLVNDLRGAAGERDAQRLRTAIEAALLAHAPESDVRRARNALLALEARMAAKQELRKAVAAKGLRVLQLAIEAAERAGLHERGPAWLGDDPSERECLITAKSELRHLAVARLQAMESATDAHGLKEALDEASRCGVGTAEVKKFTEKLTWMQACDKRHQELREAVSSGQKADLLAAVQAAEAAGLADEHLQPARQALQAFDFQGRQAATRSGAAENLRCAVRGEDICRLDAAIRAADSAGIPAAEIVHAQNRLRLLRVRDGAAKELRMAVHAADVYRLRAALAAAREAGVHAPDLQGGRNVLDGLEGQAQARRKLEGSVASQDAGSLQAAIEDARRAGLDKQQVGRAEDRLRAFGQSTVQQELAAATSSGDVGRMRAAATAAADAGVPDADVRAAWERIHALDAHCWLREQLRTAKESGDSARLQAAIQHAQAGGLSSTADVEAAQAELNRWNARAHARQELQLARASKNPYALLSAVRAAEQAGVSREEIGNARSECHSLDPGRAAAGAQPIPAGPTAQFQSQSYVAPPTELNCQRFMDPQLQASHTQTTLARSCSGMTNPQTNPQLSAPPTDVQGNYSVPPTDVQTNFSVPPTDIGMGRFAPSGSRPPTTDVLMMSLPAMAARPRASPMLQLPSQRGASPPSGSRDAVPRLISSARTACNGSLQRSLDDLGACNATSTRNTCSFQASIETGREAWSPSGQRSCSFRAVGDHGTEEKQQQDTTLSASAARAVQRAVRWAA